MPRRMRLSTRLSLPILLLCGGVAHAQSASPAAVQSARPAATPIAVQSAAALPAGAAQDGWFVTRTMAPGEMVRTEDVEIRKIDNPIYGTFSIDHSPAGMEVKHRIMAGRPLLERDVGRHALVRANGIVRVSWQSPGIHMDLEGRALQDGAAGDQIRVLNTLSARTLQGVVMPDGSVQVGGGS